MKNNKKYLRNYSTPPCDNFAWMKKEYIEKAPQWCSVDLRDANQALIVPMNLEEKLEYFRLLIKLGFKQIEVAFPAASETEFEFCRALIDGNMIPNDVYIQVLTQSRDHIIKKTFEAIKGAKNVIMHLYNATSKIHRDHVFKKSEDEIVKIAVDGVGIIKKYIEMYSDTNFIFEYSPEFYTATEYDFALTICNSVIDAWKPTEKRKIIINLPATVELSLPHIYANQIEFMSNNLNCRENVILSLHTHNDRGCAVAATELAILAGGERVEGTLFGNGERTGNVDLITLAMNLYTHGIENNLNLSDMPLITEVYEKMTSMSIHERQPYAGELVFTAFSGSHQDAIAKCMEWHKENNITEWNIPYLPLDPADVSRSYDTDVIRINSQSGKGGIGYILKQKFGIDLPPKLREIVGYAVKSVSDKQHKELQPNEIYEIFKNQFVNIGNKFKLIKANFNNEEIFSATLTMEINGEKETLLGEGNGHLDAIANAIKNNLNLEYTILHYSEHALGISSTSYAMSYVQISDKNGTTSWGAGMHPDIITSSIMALISAINNINSQN